VASAFTSTQCALASYRYHMQLRQLQNKTIDLLLMVRLTCNQPNSSTHRFSLQVRCFICPTEIRLIYTAPSSMLRGERKGELQAGDTAVFNTPMPISCL